MSTKQATLPGMTVEPDDHEEEEDDDEDTITCPICGDENVSSKVSLPHHIASDDCDSELKEVTYEF